MNSWGHHFSQNANQKCSRFLSWEGRTEFIHSEYNWPLDGCSDLGGLGRISYRLWSIYRQRRQDHGNRDPQLSLPPTVQYRTGPLEGLKIRECQYYLVCIICPPLVEIGLIDLPKNGGAMAPPVPPGTFNTFLQGRGTCLMAEKPVSPFPNRSFFCKKGKCSKQEYARCTILLHLVLITLLLLT